MVAHPLSSKSDFSKSRKVADRPIRLDRPTALSNELDFGFFADGIPLNNVASVKRFGQPLSVLCDSQTIDIVREGERRLFRRLGTRYIPGESLAPIADRK